MSDGVTSDRVSAQSAECSQEVKVPTPPTSSNQLYPLAQPVSGDSEKTDVENLKDELRRAEKWMIWLTGAIAIFGLCAVVVSFLQWRMMSNQLDEMKSGSTDTHELAVQAKKQADSMNDLARRMKEQAGQAIVQANAANNQVNKLEAGVRETHALAQQAQRANDISAKALEVQERPWVGETGMDIQGTVSIGQQVSAQLLILNSGKSPAIHTFVNFLISGKCGEFPTNPKYHPTSTPSIMVVPPNVSMTVGNTSLQITNETIDFLSRTECNLYIYGRIVYSDTFGHSHWRHLCSYWRKGTPNTFSACPFYQDGDEDYPSDGKEPQ